MVRRSEPEGDNVADLSFRTGSSAAIAGGSNGFFRVPYPPGTRVDLASRLFRCADHDGRGREDGADIRAQRCATPRSSIGRLPDAPTYPGEEAFDTFTAANCPPAFQAYTGMDFYGDTAIDYDIGLFYPLEEGWGRGDHEITCYIVRVDAGPMTASLKKQ